MRPRRFTQIMDDIDRHVAYLVRMREELEREMKSLEESELEMRLSIEKETAIPE